MEGALSKSYEPNITMMPKPDKNKTKQKNIIDQYLSWT